MCGIAGFYGEGTVENLHEMTVALRHRGPDAENFFIDKQVYLGHRRLVVLDPINGKQPMQDRETGLTLIYNGEIYNHAEIRAELKKKGHYFRTGHSDTETVLQAFLEWGTDCFLKFNGMFALAFYSPTQHKIWLARDRFGEKPLFYTCNRHGFAFASEILALSKWDYFNSDIDLANLQRFLGWGYLPGERTLHPDCKSLLPGSWLEVDLTNLTLHQEIYWQFVLTPDESLTDQDEPALIEELRVLIVQAVKRRLLSDVPLGIFLSGGLDSGIILAATAQILPPERINAFTIGFQEQSFDESAKAQAMSQFCRVKNHLSLLTAEQMYKLAPQILARMSEPLGDASLIPTFCLASFARKKVTVALSGDGGDELFAGYDPFVALAPAKFYRQNMPRALHSLLRRAVQMLPCSDRNMSLEFKLKRVLRGLSYPCAMQLPVWMSPLEPTELIQFFAQPLKAEEIYEDALTLWAKHPEADLLTQALYFFTTFYLSNDILVKSDRASMMVSLESRAVFLDNDLVDFCCRLPNRFKYRNGVRKYLLRKVAEGWMPRKLLKQPKKGFGIPLNLWLRKMSAPVVDIAGLRHNCVQDCLDQFQARQGDFRLFLWSLHALAGMSALWQNGRMVC